LLPEKLREFYNSSPMREGVLCWYPFERSASVLDLSGGALTELLQSRCECVVAAGADTDALFDYIVLLDPLDFSVNAMKALLMKLNPHGRLLLAYENPFALRYWAGKRAHNTGRSYDTLYGHGKSPLPSKAELEIRLKLAGFEGLKWYYTLPDHWFTTEVYSDDYKPNEHLNQRYLHYVPDDEGLQFNEYGLYREIIRGGGFCFMSGAYLVEARVDESDEACVVDYATVTSYRDQSKRFVTTVRSDGTVQKAPMHPDGLDNLKRIKQNHDELALLGINILEVSLHNDILSMPFMNLPTLNDYWADNYSGGTLSEIEIIKQFDRIRESIYKASATGRCYWELVPANCFYDKENDEMIFFDQEYYSCGISPDVALVRAILGFEYSSVFSHVPLSKTWISLLRERYGLTDNWDELAAIAHDKTWKEVVGEGYMPLVESTERARKRVIG
jgi:hypothetical protein